jgi:putative protease
MVWKNKKVELLAPAGNFEKLEMAVHFGADAVYLANKEFSLRNFSDNFTLEEMKAAKEFAEGQGVRVYVACNIYARSFEHEAITTYLEALRDIGPDAVIVADPGIFMTARRIIPDIPIHLSTQANTTSAQTVLFWEDQGIKRVNMARELSLEEIKEISRQTSAEIEAFVHGAMCISYSGRCLLSTFLSGRDSNRGMCTHPCRWEYSVVEALRPGEYMPVAEDDRGTYIFNSRDLCMIEHIPEMIDAGIVSLKIEGRMKSINYLASTVKVYREAIDAYYADPEKYEVEKGWKEELASISHRGYCTGFYLEDPEQVAPNAFNEKPLKGHRFLAKVTGAVEGAPSTLIWIDVRNKIFKNDPIEVLGIRGPLQMDKILEIRDPEGTPIEFAQPGSRVQIRVNNSYGINDLIRQAEEA